MLRISTCGAAAALMGGLLISSPSPASDQCSFLGVELTSLSGGDSFVLTKEGWKPFTSIESLNLKASTRIRLAYVVKPSSGNDQSGVLVVKSNRVATNTDREDAIEKVLLLRRHVTADRGCAAPLPLPDEQARVSTEAYDDYHDWYARDSKALRREESILTSFHFAYQSDARRGCVRTDDDNFDWFPWRWTSNRSQFSFNTTVVDFGIKLPWQVLRTWTSGFAERAENRTRVQKYKTVGGLACVKFSVPITGEGYSIRINDLEGRTLPSNRRKEELRK